MLFIWMLVMVIHVIHLPQQAGVRGAGFPQPARHPAPALRGPGAARGMATPVVNLLQTIES